MKNALCSLLSTILLAGCGGESKIVSPSAPSETPAIAAPEPEPAAAPGRSYMSVVLIGAGDIGEPVLSKSRARDTGELLRKETGNCATARVFTLGDNAQGTGTSDEFEKFYEPFWGFAKPCTYPVPGNHDYMTANGAAYYAYFKNSGSAGQSFYKERYGAWDIFALNSELIFQSNALWQQQLSWFRAELANQPSECSLVYFHRPRFASGTEAARQMHDIWVESRKAGIDLIVNGHAHYYEEFSPQDENAKADPHGPRQIIAGTGGTPLRYPAGRAANSARLISAHGLLKLVLRPDGYNWEFLSVEPGIAGTIPVESACQGKPRV